MAARKTFQNGFVAAMQNVLWLEENGYTREQIAETIQLSKTRIIAALRIYRASLGLTPDSAKIEIRNRATELVKLLEADEISLTAAENAFIAELRNQGIKPIQTNAASAQNPQVQLTTYRRAVAALEGICQGLDKMPDMVHSGINQVERQEIETRLASCRRTIEQRINIFRRDTNGLQGSDS